MNVYQFPYPPAWHCSRRCETSTSVIHRNVPNGSREGCLRRFCQLENRKFGKILGKISLLFYFQNRSRWLYSIFIELILLILKLLQKLNFFDFLAKIENSFRCYYVHCQQPSSKNGYIIKTFSRNLPYLD